MSAIRTSTRQGLAILLIVSLLAGMYQQSAEAGISSTVHQTTSKIVASAKVGMNKINDAFQKARNLVIGTISVGGGLMGASAGALIGALWLGPVGFLGGALIGYLLCKGLTGMLLRSSLVIVGGVVLGACLTGGMGFLPMIGGALIGGIAGKLLAKGTLMSVQMPTGSSSQQTSQASEEIYFAKSQSQNEQPQTSYSTAQEAAQQRQPVSTSIQAHREYEEAYRNYTQAAQNGDTVAAQKWLAIYRQAAQARNQANSR